MTRIRSLLISLGTTLVLFFIPVAAFASATVAQEYTPLVGIPGVGNASDFNSYLNAIYALAISLAALIAVVKIVLAGAQYMLSDMVTKKEDAKANISSSIIGLLIIIGAVVILNTINSDLTNLKIAATGATMDTRDVNLGSSFIGSVADLEKLAERIKSPMTSLDCDSFMKADTFLGIAITESAKYAAFCKNLCTEVYNGIFYNGNDWFAVPGFEDAYNDSCTFIQSEADQCQPQNSFTCCVNIKGGEWLETGAEGSKCTISADVINIRKSQCAGNGNTWDIAGDTCSTIKCDPDTDALCCTHSRSNYIWQDNVCVEQVIAPIL